MDQTIKCLLNKMYPKPRCAFPMCKKLVIPFKVKNYCRLKTRCTSEQYGFQLPHLITNKGHERSKCPLLS